MSVIIQCEDQFWEVVNGQSGDWILIDPPILQYLSALRPQISDLRCLPTYEHSDLSQHEAPEMDGDTCTERRFISWPEDKHALRQVLPGNWPQWYRNSVHRSVCVLRYMQILGQFLGPLCWPSHNTALLNPWIWYWVFWILVLSQKIIEKILYIFYVGHCS